MRPIAWRAATVMFLLIALGIAVSAGRAIDAAIVAVLAVIAIALLVVKTLAWRKYPNGD